MRSVRPVFSVVACAAVILPAVTAASISLVASATSAVINADFFAPAIAPSVSPAARRVLIVAASMPIVVAISASCAVRRALLAVSSESRSAS